MPASPPGNFPLGRAFLLTITQLLNPTEHFGEACMPAIRLARLVFLTAPVLAGAIPNARYFAAKFDVDGLLLE
ncbi:MAG: hypothetical protein AUG07_05325 [Acidobacteria bacterium 13_1_20CM_2_60_10]|nr:MAG: hypothetical protein AUG07_05325 [Acidobacteria bacterium 13_1_20CM_2_60_10]